MQYIYIFKNNRFLISFMLQSVVSCFKTVSTKHRSGRSENSLNCSMSQVAPSHRVGWEVPQLADCSP